MTTLRCACGSVELDARGAPIVCAVCYCKDCQEGGRRIEALPNARPVLDPHGGTELVLYRKDRVRCSRGEDLLRAYKLDEKSITKRVVASCCNSAMYLGFERGPHWLSLYRARFAGKAPPLQMRVQTKSRPIGGELPSDVPGYPGLPLVLVGKLVAARIAMLFSR